jgi:hypothetical protein
MNDENEPHWATGAFGVVLAQREFTERTGTSFNHLQYPTDVACLVVLWRVRYKVSLRDLPEMFMERGLVLVWIYRDF